MTGEEMLREFNLLYNNIMSNAAPGLDEYEISVFLTKAQEGLVTALYNNSFEGNENLRECLDTLVTSTILTTPIQIGEPHIDGKYTANSTTKVFNLPTDLLYIVYEELIIKSDDKCLNDKTVIVKPTTHDDYYKTINNPFKRARQREALRLNIGSYTAPRTVEIISTYPNYEYLVRYIRKPKPIILINLSNTGLTVDNYTNKMDCELHPMCHRAIVDAAVQLAAAAYKN